MVQPPPKESKGEIRQFKLKGHSAPVLCLAHSSSSFKSNKSCIEPSCLLSGSEDGTARLWDLRCSTRASICIISPKVLDEQGKEEDRDVNSVAFHPLQEKGANLNNGISKNFTVYTAVGKHVYGYDLRLASSPILKEPTFDLSSTVGSKDEINVMAFSHLKKKNSKIHLAVADDYGDVRVTDLAPYSDADKRLHSLQGKKTTSHLEKNEMNHSCNQRLCRVLEHDKDGYTLATSCAFRPHRNLEIASAGTDCTINIWDISKPRRPCSMYTVQRDDSGTNQMCNPPIIHSLSWSPSGYLLAAGLGDGGVMVLAMKGRKLVEACRLRQGHTSAVACVLFPLFEHRKINESSLHVTSNDRMLISAGNDGAILLWDLKRNVAGDHAVDPATLFHGCDHPSPKKNNSVNTNIDHVATEAIKNLSLTSMEPKILFGIPHQLKPNFLACSQDSNTLPVTLFVADTSCEITAYSLPLL